MPSRALADLHPTVAEKARALIELCKREGVDLLITSTYRSFEEQAKLYAMGRTAPGNVVTNAKPGSSWHNYGLAFDVVPLVNGKAVWDTNMWPLIGMLGESLGLTWGGRWKKFKDLPHFEHHPGLTLAEARRRKAQGEALIA
jgi:peptidoglycan L-alanyl-D-glutamate endopeptidase CwlK